MKYKGRLTSKNIDDRRVIGRATKVEPWLQTPAERARLDKILKKLEEIRKHPELSKKMKAKLTKLSQQYKKAIKPKMKATRKGKTPVTT